jgi:hypothetical protein
MRSSPLPRAAALLLVVTAMTMAGVPDVTAGAAGSMVSATETTESAVEPAVGGADTTASAGDTIASATDTTGRAVDPAVSAADTTASAGDTIASTTDTTGSAADPAVSATATMVGVHDVGFEVRGQQVHVTYDLMGTGTCEIALRMLRGGTAAPMQPRSLSGDIGPGIKAGPGKRIVWETLADVVQLEGTDFAFEVRAVRDRGGQRLMWLGGAGLLAGAGAAYLRGTDDAATPAANGTLDLDIPDPQEGRETAP